MYVGHLLYLRSYAVLTTSSKWTYTRLKFREKAAEFRAIEDEVPLLELA